MKDINVLLKEYYGYSTFRKGQDDIINTIIAGNDSLVIMPTGGGKSICYQISAMMLEGITIVISPLISLMKDQVDVLKTIGIPATFINSSLDISEYNHRMIGLEKGKYKIVYIAPERLENETVVNRFCSLNISQIAIDEAHCVSHWGHDFRPSYVTISQFINNLENRPVVSAFTATATPKVREDIIDLLDLKQPKIFVQGFDRENLNFKVIRGAKREQYILDYINKRPHESGIIYCSTRKQVEQVYNYLKLKKCNAGKYHAGLSDMQRIKNQEAFLYDKITIMVATNAFGMGIDKSNIRFVFHYNMPKNIEAYYQEAGRAGRDGEDSECILFFQPQDIQIQKYMIEHLDESTAERKKIKYEQLQKMVDYCYITTCVRKYILEYFGEVYIANECGNCSNCNQDIEYEDITIEAQKIFSCIYRMKQRFGTTLVAKVLKGSKSKEVYKYAFDKLSTYSIMRKYSIKNIQDIINMLVAEKYIRTTEDQYPVLKLEEKAFLVLKDKLKVEKPVLKQVQQKQDDELFESLRVLRKEIAEKENVPPFVIFHDSTLKEMAKKLPITEQDMLTIKGVGIHKYEKYGASFIENIKQHKGTIRDQ
ncbi:MAG: DNA helicase RecQ [Eubacteriales bacterium]